MDYVTLYNLAHVGFIVADLQIAIPRVEEALGIRFAEPAIARAPVLQEGERRRELALPIAWSREGPPYIELIEGNREEGLYSLAHGEGFHHLGFWEPDFGALERHLDAIQLPAEATQFDDASAPIAIYTRGSHLHGMRLEFVNENRIADTLAWLSGKGWTDGPSI